LKKKHELVFVTVQNPKPFTFILHCIIFQMDFFKALFLIIWFQSACFTKLTTHFACHVPLKYIKYIIKSEFSL